MPGSAKFAPAALAGAAVLALAGPAQAQMVFGRAPPFAFNPAFVPAYSSPYNLSSSYYRTQFGSAYFASPTGGYGFSTMRQYYSSAPLLFTYPSGVYAPYGAYAYGTSGGLTGAGADLAERERAALGQAQRAARNDAEARLKQFDQWAVERGSKPLDPAAEKNLPDAIRKALASPIDADINSGKSLNALLAGVQELQKAGAKAETPFLPPDLLEQIWFHGGAAADALNAVRGGPMDFPPALMSAEYEPIRKRVEADAAAIIAQVRAGKKFDFVHADQLGQNARALRTKATPALKAGDAPAKAAADYLDRLDAVAKLLKSADGPGLFVPAWRTEGAGLDEFGRFAAKYKVEFGPAHPGGEAAYAALHRGLAAYYTQLTNARR